MADRPYVRVYHSDLISDYPDVWDDDAALASWLRLLVAADGSWPAPAELPRSVKERPLTALITAGLVSLVRGHRYQVKGLDAERSQRQDAARNAAAKRWQSEGNATRNAGALHTRMPSRAEPSHTEPSSHAPASEERWDAPETEALAWLAKHGCSITPGNGYHRHLVTMVEVHGVNAVVGMFDRLASAGMKEGDTQGYVFGAKDALNAGSRPTLRSIEKDDASEREADRTRRNVERTKRHLHEIGHHQDEADPLCPACVEVGAAR